MLKCPVRKYFWFMSVAVTLLPAGAATPDWSISPQTARVCVGDSIKLHASSTDAGATAKTTHWSTDLQFAKFSSAAGSEIKVTVLNQPATRLITIQASTVDGRTESVAIGVPDECATLGRREVIRAMLGMEQTGASGTPSSQSFLFDFFITRPAIGPRVRWWGDVKVTTFPQQINSQMAMLEQQFAAAFGNIKVNQMAQAAEFVMGPELAITPDAASRFQLTLFGGGGAMGPNNPSDAATVFSLPTAGTSAWNNFASEFGAPPDGARYVAFLPNSNTRFLRQWQAGMRLYSTQPGSNESGGSVPATIEISVGQNELVTSGHLVGYVGHVAAVHPFVLNSGGKAITIYLFGEATTGFTRAALSAPIALAPALSNSSPVPLTDPGVFTITVPANRRDTYRIGVGIDLASLVNALFGGKKASAPTAN